jgi:hypothetical protein
MNTVIGKRYRHYKGNEYSVIAIGRLESSPEEMYVVYRAEYSSPAYGDKTVWIRLLKDFEGEVIIDGKAIPRFSLINN